MEKRILGRFTGCTRSRRCGSFDKRIGHMPGFCFRSESERASLRFQARREHKVNPIARSTLITLLSLIARKSRRIDRGCKTLIETVENLERLFSLRRTLKVFSISRIWRYNIKSYFNLLSLSNTQHSFFKISILVIFISFEREYIAWYKCFSTLQ